MTNGQFKEIPEFQKDYKRLCKKYRHLEEDFGRFMKVLSAELPNHLRGTVQISGLGEGIRLSIYKVKKFRSIDFKGKGVQSGFRIIYAYEQCENQVIFIQFYHKNKQANEDRERICKYFSE
jgi:mRNA-degrading endonuclease RelE of RelBE toxin-antitoxin system